MDDEETADTTTDLPSGDLPPMTLVPLTTFVAVLEPPIVLPATPAGTRMIFGVAHGRANGERLSGAVIGTNNGDWFTVGPDGTGTLDVRTTLQTDDGAIVFIQYLGRVDTNRGFDGPIYIAPRFETGDERYRWLNTVQAVGRGRFDGVELRYDICEVR